jgi:hypothetical protein
VVQEDALCTPEAEHLHHVAERVRLPVCSRRRGFARYRPTSSVPIPGSA